MPLSSSQGVTRRSLIAGVAGLVGGSLIGAPAVRADLNAVTALTPADAAIDLYLQVGRKSKVVGSVPAATTVRVLAGPSVEGWYLVDTGQGASANQGWTPGATLTFTQRARIIWDAGLFTGTTDATGWISALRHGIVVSVEGPAINGFNWVRYGDISGFTYSAALQETDLPLTDRYGEWWADVNRSTGMVNLMIGETVVDSFPASMSSETGEGFYSTAIGRYWIYQKVEGLQFTPYADAYFMYWAGFDSYRFNGFHSWTMDGNGYVLDGGWGNTAGCVATEPKHAAIIYNFLSLNSRVEIHW